MVIDCACLSKLFYHTSYVLCCFEAQYPVPAARRLARTIKWCRLAAEPLLVLVGASSGQQRIADARQARGQQYTTPIDDVTT